MTKIVINECFGGFGLSDEAIRLILTKKNIPFEERPSEYGDIMFCEPGGKDWSLYNLCYNMDRSDPILVEVVEHLGDKANGPYAKLVVEEIPKGTFYIIDEYGGSESITTQSHINWSVA